MNKKVKKLALSRQTVKRLEDNSLQAVVAGITQLADPCMGTAANTCRTVCPCTTADCSVTKACSGCCQ